MALVTAPAALPMQVRNVNINTGSQPIRLTARGRRLVALLALIPIVVTFWLVGTHGAQASDSSSSPSTVTIVVKPGQSLWDIAANVNPNKDPREIIWTIEQLNGMQSADVLAGQQLIVPAN